MTGAQTSESEELSVGGLDNVDVTIFDDFDYVALGHIHRPQTMGRDTVCYAGTPLKYSFSEANHQKAAVIVDVKEKGNIEMLAQSAEITNDNVEVFRKVTDECNSATETIVSVSDELLEYIKHFGIESILKK